MPIKGRKARAALPRVPLGCCRPLRGGGSPGGAAPVSVCPSPGCSSSPHTPRHDEAGLIHSSHRRVLFFDISCSAFPARVPLSVGGHSQGTAAHRHSFHRGGGEGGGYASAYGSSTASMQPSAGCKRSCLPSRTFQRGKMRGVGWGGTLPCNTRCAQQPGRPSPDLCDVFSFVPVPESSTRQGLPAPSPAFCG